ncbi:membrane-bound lytic murein transglycosylase B [Longispora fulva]|uniref:Membrane-bound lytic murein transglycosylase B n=1 Tax=Longispora fulva TaxID=619741 RepID=A0A8J7GLM1_9ACTN|nr:membrane-bound lytic murein transglycosylase B [Longispora fulva]
MTSLFGTVVLISVLIAGNFLLPTGKPAVAEGLPEPQPTAIEWPTPQTNPTGTPAPNPSTASLAAWAAALSPKLDIPAVAIQAYGSAELKLAETRPSCHLAWTTLAGLGSIESNHGRTAGSTLLEDGRTSKPITGIPLDGRSNTQVIKDTDQGQMDGDREYDRAVGPMQFIPSTWKTWGADGNADGTIDPSNIFDAALAAANYMCSGTRDLSNPADWQSAVLSYNAVQIYLRDVFAKADDYGKRSRGR